MLGGLSTLCSLLGSLKKALTERALNAEMEHHLAGDEGVGNTLNGYGRKTVATDTGKLAIEVPRDRLLRFGIESRAGVKRRGFFEVSSLETDFRLIQA